GYSSRMKRCSSRRARPVDGSSWMSARTGRAGGVACGRAARSLRRGATTGAKRQRPFCDQICNNIQRRLAPVEVTAASLYEAVAQGLAAIRGHEWDAGMAQGMNVVRVPVAGRARSLADGFYEMTGTEHCDAGGAKTAWFKDTEGNILAVSQRL